jgi:AmmeMemoRadiSam system protein B
MIASTDLVHYGQVYDFLPSGPPPAGFAWARKADEAIIHAFLSLDTNAALNKANTDRSACSVGAAIAAMTYALRMGALKADLLARGSSDEASSGSDASVGYCSVSYRV